MNGVVTAAEALKRLQEGNNRFVSGLGTRDLALEHRRCRELATEQAPFAIVLGCSDSRVPAELVFDQGLGDLFVFVFFGLAGVCGTYYVQALALTPIARIN